MTGAGSQTGQLGLSYCDESDQFVIQGPQGTWVNALVTEFTSWVELPAEDARQLQLRDLVRRARALTGWSTRALAEVVGTTHTTIRKFERGDPVSVRSQAAAARVPPLVDVLTRLARVAGSSDAFAAVLRTPSEANERVVDMLSSRDWAKAYLVGLDVLRGRRPDMLAPTGDWPMLPATRELI